MTEIDYTKLMHDGQARQKVTRDEFVRECAARSGATVEHILQYHDVTKCDCGEPDCPGWRARYMFRNERRRKGLE